MTDDLYAWRSAKPVVDIEPRCHSCNRMLAYVVSRPWRIKCRCRATNQAGDVDAVYPPG